MRSSKYDSWRSVISVFFSLPTLQSQNRWNVKEISETNFDALIIGINKCVFKTNYAHQRGKKCQSWNESESEMRGLITAHWNCLTAKNGIHRIASQVQISESERKKRNRKRSTMKFRNSMNKITIIFLCEK